MKNMTQRSYSSKAVLLSKQISLCIKEKKLGHNGFLPGETELAELYSASRNTIRKALNLCREQGIVMKEPNRPWVIAAPKQQNTLVIAKNHVAIGFLYAAYPDAMLIELADGIRQYINEYTLEFQVYNTTDSHSAVQVLEAPQDWGFDGLIVLPHPLPRYIRRINRLVQQKYPILSIGTHPGLTCGSIDHDVFGGVFRAVSSLLKKYSQPVYYFGAVEFLPCYRAYCQAMLDHGFASEINICTCDCGNQSINPETWQIETMLNLPFEQAKNFLRNLTFPASVLSANSYMCHGLYRAASALKIRIPEDLRIVNYGELPLLQKLDPPVSTVTVNFQELGFAAAQRVHRMILNESICKAHVRRQVEFSQRKSS